jgi:predicted ATP-dependent serine protease
MDLQLNTTRLTKVSDIKIPDIFNRRIKTGISKIDALFDEGVLPGSAMTLTAKAGCGKTTFMLQLLDGMNKNGYKTGYFSGEESIYQLAFTANRVNSSNVSIANMTDIDDISEYMEELDFIVIDSFQALTTRTKMNSRQLEKHAVQTLTRRAKDTECTVVFIMHLTKSGDLKGGTVVPHTVDANLKIDRVDDVDNDGARVIYFEKNRFGPCNELETVIGPQGYDFDVELVREEDTTKVPNKKNRKQEDYNLIIETIADSKNGVKISDVTKLMSGNYNVAYSRLRDLIAQGNVEKTGRGPEADYILCEHDTETVQFAAQRK